jgi:F-type H+-transporting ATPase subunit delta
MVTGSLGRRYARAIIDLGSAQGNLDKVGADLRGLAATMKTSAELASALTNPAIRRADRSRVIDALLAKLSAAPLSKTIVALLLDRERLAALPDIARELDAMIETRAGRVAAEVVSATALTAPQLDQITKQLEQLSGKKVTVTKREDPALLGGVVAKLGDTVYDGSLRTQLRTLRDDLAR